MIKKPALVVFWLALIALRATPAFGLDFPALRSLVVFGDSLSDNGNTFAAARLPQPPYFQGRWTNGLNWVDYFAPLAELPPATAYLQNGGTNFAVGGSTSETLAIQIGAYLATTGGGADPNDLHVIWIGGNDYNAGFSANETVNLIRFEIAVLRFAGARRFILVNCLTSP